MDIVKLQENLKQRGFAVSYFDKKEDAAQYICGQICGQKVGLGGSVTLDQMGLYEKLIELETVTEESKAMKETLPAAILARKELFTKMEELREIVDTLETMLPRKMWPFPTYAEILYSVK